MSVMKNLVYLFLICVFAFSCNTGKNAINASEEVAQTPQDTVRIANDEIEYEIIIIEPGFNSWVLSTARPRGFHGQTFLENRNSIMVTEWNLRVRNSFQYDPNLYQLEINYNPQIDYGYEVNYLLYNYFIYFQLKYNQRLSNFRPRI